MESERRRAEVDTPVSDRTSGVWVQPKTNGSSSAWQAPIAGALGLLLLNAVYAVFAAFFAASPKLAVFAFGAALALTAYESLEYSRTVFLGLGVLLIFLWMRTRRSYRHG